MTRRAASRRARSAGDASDRYAAGRAAKIEASQLNHKHRQ